MKKRLSLSDLFLILFSFLSIFILLYFNGTGLEADSYHHHLIARFAPIHPELYLDHWGKPLYTLISSPFAQFGINGSKVFNVLCSLLSFYLAYRILKHLKIELAAWVIPIAFLIPLSFQINFSSFTEPLFALLLLLSIFLILKDRKRSGAILLSFLPLVRSEGLIFLIVFALYFLLIKEKRLLIYLLVGQILFDLLGAVFLGRSLLWIWTEIPYANLDSPYGSGKLTHFVEQLFYILGPVFTALFCLSLLMNLWLNRSYKKESYLFLILFLSFFLFHSLSWYLGLFNSLGLKRVFGAILPIMAIIMVIGLEQLVGRIINPSIRKSIMGLICITTAALLFSKGPAGINWEREMNLSPPQELALEVCEYIEKEKIIYGRVIFADRFLFEGLNTDPYDPNQFLLLQEENYEKLQENDLVIWDNWHAVVDFGVNENNLTPLGFKKVKELVREEKSRTVKFVLYSKR